MCFKRENSRIARSVMLKLERVIAYAGIHLLTSWLMPGAVDMIWDSTVDGDN
jgi:hypothetical protein